MGALSSIGRVLPVFGKQIRADKEAKKKIEEETAAIEESERRRKAAAAAKQARRSAFQESLNVTGGQAATSGLPVATGNLFGN